MNLLTHTKPKSSCYVEIHITGRFRSGVGQQIHDTLQEHERRGTARRPYPAFLIVVVGETSGAARP